MAMNSLNCFGNKKNQAGFSKWPFDHPNGGHLTPERVTSTTQKGHEWKNLEEGTS